MGNCAAKYLHIGPGRHSGRSYPHRHHMIDTRDVPKSSWHLMSLSGADTNSQKGEKKAEGRIRGLRTLPHPHPTYRWAGCGGGNEDKVHPTLSSFA